MTDAERNAVIEECAKVGALKGAGREAVEAIRALKESAAPQDVARPHGELDEALVRGGNPPSAPSSALPADAARTLAEALRPGAAGFAQTVFVEQVGACIMTLGSNAVIAASEPADAAPTPRTEE